MAPPSPEPVCRAAGCNRPGDRATLPGYRLCQGHWALYAKGIHPTLRPRALDDALALANQQPTPQSNTDTDTKPTEE